MIKSVRFDDEASEELDAAALWYEEQNPGIGAKLIQAAREATARLAESPGIFSHPPGVPLQLGVRHCSVRRFPYALIFVELVDEIRVLAFAHYRRRPGYWRSRL
jgi:plasmid stabilization system protein ParE